jgi:xanthine dehydrogenase large subunit
MGSKATGEPPFIYGMAAYFALRNAVKAYNPKSSLRFPATPEAILDAIESR